jgi:malonyl-CoA/methylmalonyl-CoA synthetase
LTLVDRASRHTHGPALVTSEGSLDFPQLDRLARRVARALLARHGASDLDERRIAFFVPPGSDWVAVALGIWRAGGTAVPLALSHPDPELDYVIRDAEVATVVSDVTSLARLEAVGAAAGVPVVSVAALLDPGSADPGLLVDVAPSRRALILYTSGTTGRPKGVVTTHANISAQIDSLIRAWQWTRADRTLLVLPLHHVHGIINVVGSALWAGATCEIPGSFDATAVWSRLASGEISVFTAVPTVYHRLIAAFDAAPVDRQRGWRDGCRRVRLMMSGSAALPVAMLERWRAITGHVLLERYGMTEIGMALANPLAGERRPGTVGVPLPGVDVRVVAESGQPVEAGTPGEVEIRGATVFLQYWRRPDATRAAFRDGWFRTGDVGLVEDGAYRLLGRADIDIIKTGGYKVSALEIEEVLRRHPAVADCAVVGVPDLEWGERVCAALESAPAAAADADAVREWARGQLAPYKIPRALTFVRALPRNAMGKVVKPEIAGLFLDPPR